MASIQPKEDSPFWIAHWRDGNSKPRIKSTKILRVTGDATVDAANELAAQALADDWEQKSRMGLPINGCVLPPPPTIAGVPRFHDFTRAWIGTVGGDRKYHDKLNGYFDNVDRFLGIKQDWEMCRLHQPDCIGLAPFLTAMGYSPTTATAHLKAVRQAFLAAVSKGFALVCPITPQHYVVNTRPILPSAMTPPQIQHLLNSMSIVDWRSTILSGYYLGMDLLTAANHRWDATDFQTKSVSYDHFTRGGTLIRITIPMHPVIEHHLLAVKRFTSSEYIAPSLQGVSDSALRAHFRKLVAGAQLPTGVVKSPLNRNYCDIQFTSLRLAFARDIGHPELHRLSRFLSSLSLPDLAKRIATFPHLNLSPLPLFGLA